MWPLNFKVNYSCIVPVQSSWPETISIFKTRINFIYIGTLCEKEKKQIHNRKIINVEVNKVLEIQFHFQMHPKTATSIFALRIASTWHHIELHTWQTCPRGKKQLTLSIYNVHLFL